MRRGWTIDEHRVEIEINAMVLTARVDRAPTPALSIRSNLIGSWPIAVGERMVELRRIRSFDVAVNQLWVDGVKVPPTPNALSRITAKADVRCKIHSSSTGSDAVPAATIECSVCGAPVCSACCAVDGVRCRECFARAVEELRRQDHANRIKGPVISIVLIGALALVGWVSHQLVFLECAGGATFLFGLLLIRGLVRERSDTRSLPPPGRR